MLTAVIGIILIIYLQSAYKVEIHLKNDRKQANNLYVRLFMVTPQKMSIMYNLQEKIKNIGQYNYMQYKLYTCYIALKLTNTDEMIVCLD